MPKDFAINCDYLSWIKATNRLNPTQKTFLELLRFEARKYSRNCVMARYSIR
jgi:hypothetical protein